MADALYRYHWHRLPGRKDTLCRVLCRGAMNSRLIRFVTDGWIVVTNRNALRRMQ